MLIGDKKTFTEENPSPENEEVVDLFSNEPIPTDDSEEPLTLDEESMDESEKPFAWKSLIQRVFGLEGQRKKHSYKWVLSVVGECLLIIPVIIVLIVIGQFFHFM